MLAGPVLIANSTFSWNRGHGIAVDNTTDGRVFINSTRIENNYGDGVWYRQKIGSNLLNHGLRERRDYANFAFAEEKPRADICREHTLPISSTHLVVCDATEEKNACALERMRIPIVDGTYPQTVSLRAGVTPLFLALEHHQEGNTAGYVVGDVDVLFRVHASVTDKAFYGLNITNSIINGNIGNGVFSKDIRERTALSNVTVNLNQGLAGFLVKELHSITTTLCLSLPCIKRSYSRDDLLITYFIYQLLLLAISGVES
ncbi:unnamed protein product [Cylicostephanus goldi]|uniref:Right handed beta helix domain-containing protein n=1 Tax=Cylicostephanus goldi TaxID=71465 RepID=A0A3P7N5L4_CYLGO|nr:unnamed protein product [Cylicostephanus goldi]